MKTLLIVVVAMMVLVAGCASPYQQRQEGLLKAYQSGQLTAEQYYTLSNQIESERTARLGMLGQSLIQQSQDNAWRRAYQQPQTVIIQRVP